MGAWIEIVITVVHSSGKIVAPFVGAWIEIFTPFVIFLSLLSLPSWERGLKFPVPPEFQLQSLVAPFVGAWIEISFNHKLNPSPVCRSLRGSVD